MDPAPTRSGFNWRLTAMIYVPALAILLLTGLGSVVLDRPPSFFIRDPGQTLGVHEFIGAQSLLGVLIWAGCVGVCLVGWTVARAQDWGDGDVAGFFLYAALFTSALLLDDMFRVHDSLFPRLGLREKPLVAAYVVAALVFAARYRRIIFRSVETASLFVAAGVFFGLSLFIDQGETLMLRILDLERRGAVDETRVFIEDGFKLLGIVAWTGYFWREAVLRLRGSARSAP